MFDLGGIPHVPVHGDVRRLSWTEVEEEGALLHPLRVTGDQRGWLQQDAEVIVEGQSLQLDCRLDRESALSSRRRVVNWIGRHGHVELRRRGC